MMEISERAAEARRHFQTVQRRGEDIWTRTDDAPEWVEELTQKAHRDFLPDDWRYQFIVEALDAIATDGEDATVEADIYNGALYGWLASNVNRASYVDEATEELGHADTISQDIAQGQQAEREEVLGLVLSFLAGMEDEDA